MSKSRRRKVPDSRVLNRQELYEKYIPHISQDFAKIIEKSKNNEFKQRCQHLLQVDDPDKIQEAIAGQLFKLTLGKKPNENPGAQSADQSNIQSCFGDLADHIEDNQWPLFSGKKLPQMSSYESSSGNQDIVGRLLHKKGNTNPAIKGYKSAEKAAAIVYSEDDDFNSLEVHAMFNETRGNCATGSEDGLVPYGSRTSTMTEKTPPYYQPVYHHKNTTMKKSALKTVVPHSDVSRITKTVEHNYQTSYQQSVTSRERHVFSAGAEVPYSNTRSTNSEVPYSNTRSTISEVRYRNTSSTNQSLPKLYHRLSPQSVTRRKENVSHNVESRTTVNSTIPAKPHNCQSVPRQSDTSPRVGYPLQSDDSDFETLGNLF